MWGGWPHVWWELWFQRLLPPLIYLDNNSVESLILCTSSCTYTCDIQRYLFYLIDQKAGTQSRKRGVSILTELPALPLVSQWPWTLTIYTWVYIHESPDLLGKEAVCQLWHLQHLGESCKKMDSVAHGDSAAILLHLYPPQNTNNQNSSLNGMIYGKQSPKCK